MKAISVQEIRQIITELDPMGSIGFPNFAPYSEYFGGRAIFARHTAITNV